MAIYRCAVQITYPRPGSPGANVWHFRTGAGPGSEASNRTNAVAAIKKFYTDLGGGAAQFFANGISFKIENVVDLATNESYDQDVVVNGPSGTSNTCPDVLCVCVSWRTSSSTRRGRGRTFLGPLSAAVMDTNGTPTDNAIAVVGTASQNLINASLTDNGWAIGIYGLQASGGGPTAPRVLRDLVAYRVRDEFAILRSRRD